MSTDGFFEDIQSEIHLDDLTTCSCDETAFELPEGWSEMEADLDAAHPSMLSTATSSTSLGTSTTGFESVQHFDLSKIDHQICGNPLLDMRFWHPQKLPDSCAIVSQRMVLESLTGQEISEEQLVAEATAYGWYTPNGGTNPWDVGKLLELHGVGTQMKQSATLDEIARELAQGHKVIVGLDGDEIRTKGEDYNRDEVLGDPVLCRGRDANHAVEVIGVDYTNPSSPEVIINDPGAIDGCGLTLPANKFLNAWRDSDNTMISTTGLPPVSPLAASYTPKLAGYYNSDGTYHYNSDNTDRDPQTGAIIRRY